MLPRLRLLQLLPLLLVGLVYHASAQQQQISGTSLYPEELIPLITRADALLTAGQFNDAARAYSEAIGESWSLCSPASWHFGAYGDGHLRLYCIRGEGFQS